MEKKEQIYQYIRKDTLDKIKKKDYDHLGIDTLAISLDLMMNRANISRILNQLYNDGRVVKTSGRPVLFADRSVLDRYLNNTYIPSIIPKDKKISDYFSGDFPSSQKDSFSSFDQYITNPRYSKMYEPVNKAKSAILYPKGLNILIFGEPGIGKMQFAKSLVQYAKEVQFIDEKVKPTVIDCLNYAVQNQKSFLKLIFGEYSSEAAAYKRGIFQLSQNNIVILNNIDKLPAPTSSTLYNAILNKSFSPVNSNKIFELKSRIIAISTTQSLLDDPDIHRCFPILIDLPDLYERSIPEKLAIILQYLQEEAININKTIRISKDALSCFVMSKYKGNLAHLRAELRQSCAIAYQNYLNKHAIFIDIGFDEISTAVLTNIFDITERISELEDTLSLFNNDHLFFSPHQENPELQLLFDLNQASGSSEASVVQSADEELINQCIADIDSASSIHLNTIRSILLQKIYDLIYPIVKEHPVCKNENLLYGLLLHISNIINHFSSNGTHSRFSHLTSKIARKNDYRYTEQIRDAIEACYEIKLSEAETDYIATYLYLSSQWIDKRYIQLLIVSTNKDIAKSYADYINSQYFKTYTSYLSFTQNEPFSQTLSSITEKMNAIDKGRGVIIITDNEEIQKASALLAEGYRGEFSIVSELSIQKLVSIAEKAEFLGATIQSVHAFEDFKPAADAKSDTSIPHAQNLLQDIQRKLLSESLVFLNPEKACQALFNILLNIMNELSIQYSDDLLIKFLFHTTFALERCIRKEPYVYPKSRSLIQKYNELFNVIERNFKIINEIFSIQIPTSEMGFIIEIFLPYLNN